MATVDFRGRRVSLCVLLWGPSGALSASAVRELHGMTPPEGRGDLQTIDTFGGPVACFHFETPGSGRIPGFRECYFVTGCPRDPLYNLTKWMVFGIVDAVILVLDAGTDTTAGLEECLEILAEDLASHGRTAGKIPLVAAVRGRGRRKILSSLRKAADRLGFCLTAVLPGSSPAAGLEEAFALASSRSVDAFVENHGLPGSLAAGDYLRPDASRSGIRRDTGANPADSFAPPEPGGEPAVPGDICGKTAESSDPAASKEPGPPALRPGRDASGAIQDLFAFSMDLLERGFALLPKGPVEFRKLKITDAKLRNTRWHWTDRMLGDVSFNVSLLPPGQGRGSKKAKLQEPLEYLAGLKKILLDRKRRPGEKALVVLEAAANAFRLFGKHLGASVVSVAAMELNSQFQREARASGEAGDMTVSMVEVTRADGKIEKGRKMSFMNVRNIVFLNWRFGLKLLRHFGRPARGGPPPMKVEVCLAVEFEGPGQAPAPPS